MVFSSWGRLLKLVGDALTANGVEHASLCGASLQQRQVRLLPGHAHVGWAMQRQGKVDPLASPHLSRLALPLPQDALHRFTHDPACSVLSVVMSTSGGAAGKSRTPSSPVLCSLQCLVLPGGRRALTSLLAALYCTLQG